MGNISKGTLIRTIVLIIALINTLALMMGKELLPIGEADVEATIDLVYAAISGVVLLVATIATWWKNNSFTKTAIEADKYKEKLKRLDKNR